METKQPTRKQQEELRDQAIEKIASILKGINYRIMGEGYLASILYDNGFLPVEPVQLEVLSDGEIENAWPDEVEIITPFLTQADIEKEILRCAKIVSQITIAHNEAKGQLYRIKPEES